MTNTVALHVKPSVDHLMDAPLDALLAEFGVEEVEMHVIVDPTFTGYMTVGKSGQLVLAMPGSRPQAEREIVVRAMLGSAFGVDLPDLPDPYRVSVFDKDGEPHQVNPRPHRSQADEALRRVRASKWQSLSGEDIASLPIVRLLKAFGVTVTEADGNGAELLGEPGSMEFRVGREVGQQLRDSEARRLLAEYAAGARRA